MNKTRPLVTLGIPSYNSGEFLKWTLESVANQTMENFECIVVDDCSTDGSAKYFTQVVGKDPRFKLIKHKMNCGLAASRNTALRSARGKFTAFLDSDDLIMPNSLETRVATCLWALRKNSRYAGCYSGSVQIEENVRTPPDSTPVDLPFVDWISSSGTCPFNANQPMLRTDVLRAAGGFNQYLTQSEDYDLWLRILRGGYSLAPAKWSNITYRKRQGSMIRRAPMTHLQAALALLNSSQVPLADDQLEWSEYRLEAPLHKYASQRIKMGRIFEFCGMSLASDEPPKQEKLVDVILSEMPDVMRFIGPNASIHQLIANGVRRQTGSVSAAYKQDIENLVSRLESQEPDVASNPINSAEKKTAATVRPYADPAQNQSWSAKAQRDYDIAFIPHSGYHVWTVSLLMSRFEKQGLKVAIVDISPQWRDGGVRKAAEKYDIPLIGLSEFSLGSFAWKNIIVFNDWDPVTRPILIAAQECGIQTSAIVEGIQDYDDADVHWTRYAYKTADTIFLPGEFDKKYFEKARSKTAVVGVARIQTLRNDPRRQQSNAKAARVLINSNFSYGVLEEHRDAWLSTAVDSVLAAGLTPVISRHPGDKGEGYPEFVTDQTFYECLETCELSIQRFASGVLEALARDVGIIYYNPHGEKVDKFQADPMGAYTLATSEKQLRADLARWKDIREMAINNGSAFLDHHSGSGDTDLIDETVNAIIADLGTPPEAKALNQFKDYLNAIDIETSSMTACVGPNGPLFPDPTKAADVLQELYKKNIAQPHTLKIHAAKVETSFASPPQAKRVELVPDTVTIPAVRPSYMSNKLALRTAAAQLLLNPVDGLKGLQKADMVGQISEATVQLGASDPAVVHFEKAKAFALQKTAT